MASSRVRQVHGTDREVFVVRQQGGLWAYGIVAAGKNLIWLPGKSDDWRPIPTDCGYRPPPWATVGDVGLDS